MTVNNLEISDEGQMTKGCGVTYLSQIKPFRARPKTYESAVLPQSFVRSVVRTAISMSWTAQSDFFLAWSLVALPLLFKLFLFLSSASPRSLFVVSQDFVFIIYSLHLNIELAQTD